MGRLGPISPKSFGHLVQLVPIRSTMAAPYLTRKQRMRRSSCSTSPNAVILPWCAWPRRATSRHAALPRAFCGAGASTASEYAAPGNIHYHAAAAARPAAELAAAAAISRSELHIVTMQTNARLCNGQLKAVQDCATGDERPFDDDACCLIRRPYSTGRPGSGPIRRACRLGRSKWPSRHT